MVTLVLSTMGKVQEERLISALSKEKVDHLVISHLYYLTTQSGAVKRLKELQGPVTLCSWLNDRAARWVLKGLGVEGEWSYCDLSKIDDIEEFVSNLPKGSGVHEELKEDLVERWYPVIDYERCTSCQQCLEFCLFGVYEVRIGRVTVQRPHKCKPGCPACARVCPQKAIIFPHYEQDEAIAGVLPEKSVQEEQLCPCSATKNDGLDDLISDLDELDI